MKKHVKVYEEFLGESRDSEKLAPKISKAISEIDESMSYVDFAQSVAQVLVEDYGQHNFDGFISELKKSLKLHEARKKAEEDLPEVDKGVSIGESYELDYNEGSGPDTVLVTRVEDDQELAEIDSKGKITWLSKDIPSKIKKQIEADAKYHVDTLNK